MAAPLCRAEFAIIIYVKVFTYIIILNTFT